MTFSIIFDLDSIYYYVVFFIGKKNVLGFWMADYSMMYFWMPYYIMALVWD